MWRSGIRDATIAKRWNPKNNRERHVPLDLDLYEALYKRKQASGYVFSDATGQPFEGDRLNRALTNVCKKAGVRRVTWHVLRHTFASHLAMRGVPLNIVQALLGHSNVTTTMRYAHVSPSSLRPAIDMLNPKRMLNENFGHSMGTLWARSEWEQLGQKKPLAEIPLNSSINYSCAKRSRACNSCAGSGNRTQTTDFTEVDL